MASCWAEMNDHGRCHTVNLRLRLFACTCVMPVRAQRTYEAVCPSIKETCFDSDILPIEFQLSNVPGSKPLSLCCYLKDRKAGDCECPEGRSTRRGSMGFQRMCGALG